MLFKHSNMGHNYVVVFYFYFTFFLAVFFGSQFNGLIFSGNL